MTARIAIAVLLLVLCQSAQALVVLQYHHISSSTPPSTSTRVEQFSAHLEHLAEHKFQVWSLSQLAQALRKGQELPDKTAVITFDDGYISVFDTAYPLLKQRGWPFAVFINTQPHDEKLSSYMSWAQLREMSDNGVAIANHTVDHAHLTEREPVAVVRSYRRQYSACRKTYWAGVGQHHKFLAYRYGVFNAPL